MVTEINQAARGKLEKCFGLDFKFSFLDESEGEVLEEFIEVLLEISKFSCFPDWKNP